MKKVSEEKKVDLYKLIIEVSNKDRKAPTIEMINAIADKLATE